MHFNFTFPFQFLLLYSYNFSCALNTLFSTWGKVNKIRVFAVAESIATVLVVLSANDDSETWKSNQTFSTNGNCCARKQIFLYLMRTTQSFYLCVT